MAAERAEVRPEDCEWYHTSVLRSGEVMPGAWDLRGRRTAYLGATPFAGGRVLELGPASGYLSFHMEKQGAEVVGFEAGFDVPVDLIPFEGRDIRGEKAIIMETVDRVHSSWWLMHREHGSAAKLVHGSIYDLPRDIGQFDIAVFGAILLHLRDPWTAISEAARRTRERVIVTDVLEPDMEPTANVMRFAPGSHEAITNWWSISPGAVIAMLTRLGFGATTLTFHRQLHHLGHDLGAAPVEMSMFTVIGDRV